MAKEMRTDIEEIKDSIDNDKLVLGTNVTLKSLKQNQLKKIFVSSTCQKIIKDDLQHFATFNHVPVVELAYPSDEVGVFCKKPFSISVLGLLK